MKPNKITLSLLGLAALGSLSTAAVAQRDFPTADRPALADPYPERLTAFPDGVSGLPDVVYKTENGFRPMTLDIYLPPRSDERQPLVMFVHGGGWSSGHTRHSGALSDFPGALAKLASEGFVVASVEYRLLGEAAYPAPIDDVRDAIAFMKEHAEEYGVDPDRVGIWGGSAGGHLAALAALACGDKALPQSPDGKDRSDTCVDAAVIWYGVFDFTLQVEGRPDTGEPSVVDRMLGCDARCDVATYRLGSPLTYADAQDPAFLLIHGTHDRVVPADQSRNAAQAFGRIGIPAETLYLQDADHSFVSPTPEQTRAATLSATNASFDFFHAQLKGDAPGD